MQTDSTLPLVAVPACMKDVGGQPFHTVGDKYVRALAVAAGVMPVVMPNLGEHLDMRQLLATVDGVMMTGSPSNVHPSHYGYEPSEEAKPHDEARDAVTLPMIRAALDAGVPLFCICRGFQELNVVMGGTLFARVHEVPGRMDHRSPDTGDRDVDYGPRHGLKVTPGGMLERVLGKRETEINSLHWQAVDRLADGLALEGTAPDGTVEAVSVKGAKTFALGVQWHPEFRVMDNPDSVALFKAFGDAVRARREVRRRAAAA